MVIGPQTNGLLMSQENYDKSSTLWKLQWSRVVVAFFSSHFQYLSLIGFLFGRKQVKKTVRLQMHCADTQTPNSIKYQFQRSVWYGSFCANARANSLFFFIFVHLTTLSSVSIIEMVAISLCNILNWPKSNRLWNFFFHSVPWFVIALFLSPNFFFLMSISFSLPVPLPVHFLSTALALFMLLVLLRNCIQFSAELVSPMPMKPIAQRLRN